MVYVLLIELALPRMGLTLDTAIINHRIEFFFFFFFHPFLCPFSVTVTAAPPSDDRRPPFSGDHGDLMRGTSLHLTVCTCDY